jgi:F-type H+-transporting ATPase subunit b
MDAILKQLGELLLSSIPTVFLLLIVWAAYRTLVQRKLDQVLAERHARTEGAVEQARAEIASAEARTAEYEQRLREARAQIYKTQEAARQQLMERRNAALAQARQQSDELVKQSRATLAAEVAVARASLTQQAEAMAAEIIESVLKPAAAMGGR